MPKAAAMAAAFGIDAEQKSLESIAAPLSTQAQNRATC
jgi:hypothetical protein